MAAGSAAPTSGEYIVHHLTHLNTTGHAQKAVVDWSVLNIDTMFYSIVLGLLTIFVLWLAAAVLRILDQQNNDTTRNRCGAPYALLRDIANKN